MSNSFLWLSLIRLLGVIVLVVREVYERREELIDLAERVVLATLGFDPNVQHPYKPLVDAIKKFKVAQHSLARVAWNFVNDGSRTSLCLQFKPHHIATGAIFLATKFLSIKLPSDGEKVWWREFDVTPHQLEGGMWGNFDVDVIKYYCTMATVCNHQLLLAFLRDHLANGDESLALGSTQPGTSKAPPSQLVVDHEDSHGARSQSTVTQNDDYRIKIMNVSEPKGPVESRVVEPTEQVKADDVQDDLNVSISGNGAVEEGCAVA
ncbi:hypothetical protein Dimus_020845 [Dionaea muscipula]